ncbi:MAG TPA: hypothetical protein VKD89_03645 [Candidatus Udaeobacter sp.]|nr:hypothetical protein [Candidatus Udaeobacter sp.]
MKNANVKRSTLNIQEPASLDVKDWTLNVKRFLKRLVIAATASSIAVSSLAQSTPSPADSPRDFTVLILGDSLGLCGFSKRLDEKFRADPRVRSVFTYCTCGTNPLSWLKEKPYAHVQTHCGYWSVESRPDSHAFKELRDTYGTPNGHRPTSHTVPKLDDLLPTIQPDILVMQTGSNLFGLFSGREKVKPDRDGPMLRKYLVPFVKRAITPPSKVRKIYWVAPPTSGRVSGEVQEFVFNQTQRDIGSVAHLIDSRKLISYPYKHMEPDKEHFVGEDMNKWADKVWGDIDRDLSAQSWSDVRPLSESIAKLAPVAAPSATPATASLILKAKLVSKTKPIQKEELLPYREFLVGFVYDVEEVTAGEYGEKQILVMHPAYIGLQPQSLGKFQIGRTYELKLRPLDGSIWSTVKSKDDSGRIELEPYIRVQDEARYPKSGR